MGLNYAIFSLPNTKISYARGHCPLATPTSEPALWTQANMHSLKIFLNLWFKLCWALIYFIIKFAIFFWWFILNVFWLSFKKFPVNSGKKELRFGQNFKKLYSPKIQLDLTYIFSHRLFLYLHPKVFTKWHDFRLKTKQKQNKTNKQKSGFSTGGGGTFPLHTPSARQQIIP